MEKRSTPQRTGKRPFKYDVAFRRIRERLDAEGFADAAML
jgi:hypothetical protein